MKNSVIVNADKNGNVIVATSNPNFGWIKLTQDKLIVRSNGWVETKTYTAIIRGAISDLKKFGYYPGKELPGNILTRESLRPFNKQNPERDLKIAPSTGAIFQTEKGEPIYRNNFWDPTGCKSDILIPFDLNSIKEYNKVKETKVIKKPKVSEEKTIEEIPQLELFNEEENEKEEESFDTEILAVEFSEEEEEEEYDSMDNVDVETIEIEDEEEFEFDL